MRIKFICSHVLLAADYITDWLNDIASKHFIVPGAVWIIENGPRSWRVIVGIEYHD